MKVYLSFPRGFCAGVDRAVEVVSIALERFGAPIFVKHQIVHNPFVVKTLESMGAVTVEHVEDIPVGSTVVFSAHGSPPEDFEAAKNRGLDVIDATCPLVTKVHNEAHRYADEGRKLILIGHRGHQEVKGSMGQHQMHLIDDREEIDLPEWTDDTPVTILTQTTLSVDDTKRTVSKVKEKFPDTMVRNDLCYATTNRQAAVKELCKWVEAVFVIGAPNSSNCNRLREVAIGQGVEAYLVNGPEELDPQLTIGVQNLGITSGASTPEELVESVIKALNPEEVIPIRGADEDVSFVLPREMR
jgi:4-hydroxy-3-methylbut-2-enyl diphosphate reductase